MLHSLSFVTSLLLAWSVRKSPREQLSLNALEPSRMQAIQVVGG